MCQYLCFVGVAAVYCAGVQLKKECENRIKSILTCGPESVFTKFVHSKQTVVVFAELEVNLPEAKRNYFGPSQFW